MIPEIIILKILNSILFIIKEDIQSNINSEEKSYLYYLYNGKNTEGFDWYKQAKDIFSRKEDHSRKINTTLGFNSKRAQIPTIHITLPGEQNTGDGLGIDEGYQDDIYEDILDENNLKIGEERKGVYTRGFNAKYDLVITSDNTLEVLLIYHTIKSFLIVFFAEFEFSGLRNIKLSGQDIRLNNEVNPNVYIKVLSMNLYYETSIPSLFKNKIIEQMKLIQEIVVN